ncbi:MAG: ArsC/Spx/MgsR family protein [Sphaerochaetaceae bacterium]|jgi:arsenate reductase-like glutaredoxin family protein|nr:hypothetical protein [Sphaerochaetaceae bacterium]MDD3996622.1 hypothetical protein [Sphaerochaetaceae bacterium]MDX9809110.1 ArsC/Spx/MgsR family protein [Sphaerochaetaceae bacterium]NLV83673.1 hypothetical protein [Spirochaetales bacterium]
MLLIIGEPSCRDTQKAIRFCKERTIAFQFFNLRKDSLAEGHWNVIFSVLEPQTLIDTESAYYKKEGYAWRVYDASEELKAHPQLLKTPLLKDGHKVVQGFDEAWLERQRGAVR